MNRGTKPVFVSSRYQSTIDIVLATLHYYYYMAVNLIEDRHVSSKPSFADHRRVFYKLGYKPPENVVISERASVLQVLQNNKMTCLDQGM